MGAGAGFHVYQISLLKIIFPVSAAVQQHGDKAYRAIANGSFVSGVTPVSPLMVDGSLKAVGCALEKTAHRGGVAVLTNGEVAVGRLRFGDKPSGQTKAVEKVIQSSFRAPVSSFVGGGALLIENNKPVTDLGGAQHFDQNGIGIAAGQMRSTNHVVVATRNQQAYLIIAVNQSGVSIQSTLSAYDAVVLFDGGRQFWAHTPDLNVYVGQHPIGLAVN